MPLGGNESMKKIILFCIVLYLSAVPLSGSPLFLADPFDCNQVKDICTWDTVALQWKQHLYKKTERFLSLDEYKKVSVINNKVRKVFNRRFMSTEEFIEPKNEQRHIDIVTTCYNAEKHINRCILSVAQQDYDN